MIWDYLLDPYNFRSAHPEVLVKNFLTISQNSEENTCARVYFLIKLQRPETCNFIRKETLAQVFSCEFCEILRTLFFQNTGGCFYQLSSLFFRECRLKTSKQKLSCFELLPLEGGNCKPCTKYENILSR